MKNKELTDYDIVVEQLMSLYLVQSRISVINNVRIPRIEQQEVGLKVEKMNYYNYHDKYFKMLDEKNYNILFNDESLLCFYYLFDKNNKIRQHNLYYIPSIDVGIYKEENISLEEKVLIAKCCNNYIRIDYDLQGKQDIIHTDVHMHFGIYPGEEILGSYELRIPCEGLLYPYEFIYIISKYLYNANCNDLEFLLKKKYHKKILLEENEKNKFILSFCRENYKD